MVFQNYFLKNYVSNELLPIMFLLFLSGPVSQKHLSKEVLSKESEMKIDLIYAIFKI